MNFLKTKARVLLCCVIIAAFFVPAYDGISGFTFVDTAFTNARNQAEITETDVLLAVIPLVLIPIAAIIILAHSGTHRTLSKTYLALPLLFMLFFFGIIFFSAGGSSNPFSSPTVFFHMQPGFYIAGFASFLLIFTKTYKKKRRRKSSSSSAPETIATA